MTTQLLLGGLVYSSPATPDATAFAVTDGIVVWVGTDEVGRALHPDAEVIDLAGRFVSPAFVEEKQIELPIWVPRDQGPYGGYGQVSNARAVAAGLTFRPLDTTISELLAWLASQPPERQAKLRAGISREKEAELLKAWHALPEPAA